MTETPSEQPHPRPQTPITAALDSTSLERYWCYICDKVVPGKIHVDHPGIVCQECDGWYIEYIGPPPPLPTSLASYSIDQRRFGKQFLEALRRFSRLAPAEDPSPQNQPSSAMQIAGIFGKHCLYLLRFSSQLEDRGVVAPPNQQFLFDVGEIRSRSPPSLDFNPIDESRAGEQFLRMLHLISQIVPQNQPWVNEYSDQTPNYVSPLYLFLREERTFGGRFLRMLCLITQIARDEVESPNQPLTDSWDSVKEIIELYELENLNDDLGQEEDDNGHEIEGEEDGDGDENETYIRSERRIGGNLARERWANIEAGIEAPDRDEDRSANFRGGYEYDDGWSNIEAGIEVPDPDEHQSASFRGGYEYDDGWPNIEAGIEIPDRYEYQSANFRGGYQYDNGWANIEAGIEVADEDEDQSANFRGGYEYDEGEEGYEIQDETGGYVGNPGDYLDTADYETLLQILAENVGGRRGAPPASKDVVEALETLKIKGEAEILACAICQDTVKVGELAKKLPCGHGYHEDCIVSWLGSRNSCPLCRYELPTDYPDYEEERKKRVVTGVAVESSSSGIRGDESDYDTEDQDDDGADFLL